jgi:hypothetical protein
MKRLSSTTEYPWKKTRRFPIRGLCLLCSPIILMYALLGENGIIENYNARIQLLILQEHIENVQAQNLQTHRNIQLVRSNPKVALSYYQRNTFQGSEGTTYFLFQDKIFHDKTEKTTLNSEISSEQILSLISKEDTSEIGYPKDASAINITSDEFVAFLDGRSSFKYKKIDTSTKVLGYIAGTVKSVQSSWNPSVFQSHPQKIRKNQ